MEPFLVAAVNCRQDAASWAQVVILALTALVIVWYACETRRLVREVVHQNEISLRPLVLPEFSGTGAHRVFRLKNCGIGCALNVRVSPIVITLADQAGLGPAEQRFDSPYYMAAGEVLEIPTKVWVAGQPMEHSTFDNWCFPHYPGDEIQFEILFGDVEGGSYAIPVVIRAEHDQARLPRQVEIGAVRKFRRMAHHFRLAH